MDGGGELGEGERELSQSAGAHRQRMDAHSQISLHRLVFVTHSLESLLENTSHSSEGNLFVNVYNCAPDNDFTLLEEIFTPY